VKIFWRRGNEKLTYTHPETYFVQGVRGAGKSTLLENIAMKYLEKNAVILDSFASADGENLSWLRAPFIKDLKVLLLKGANVDVETSFDVRQVENLGMNDLEKYDLIISARPCYLNKDHEFYSVGQLTNLLYRRFHYKRLICLLAREASNLWYSRIKISETQADSKAEAIYLLRESRHFGVSLLLDSLRYLSIDKDVRSLTDFLFLKSQGIDGLSDDLRFLYRFFTPSFIRSMKPWEFILCCRGGSLGVGHFPFHDWHKREGEDIIKNVGLKINYGEILELPKDKGAYETVGDQEHCQIISLYVEKALGMNKVAEQLKRSTRTVMVHINRHNLSVERSGFCAPCKRMASPFYDKKAIRVKNVV
jgi:hypothetical protein